MDLITLLLAAVTLAIVSQTYSKIDKLERKLREKEALDDDSGDESR